MRFFSKPHIFTAKSNILDPQIILFDKPPSEPDQHQNYEYPKTPRREPIVSVTHTCRNGHLIRYAVVHIHVAHLVAILELKQRVGHKYRVAFFTHISRDVHTIGQRYGVFLHPIPIFGHRHDLWRLARAYARTNY